MANSGRAVLLVTMLVSGAVALAEAGALSAETDGVRVELTSQPEQPRRSARTAYTLRLVDANGTPVTGAQVTLSGRMADGMSVVAPLRAAPERGVYRGAVLFTMEGPWELLVRVKSQGRQLELPLKEQVKR